MRRSGMETCRTSWWPIGPALVVPVLVVPVLVVPVLVVIGLAAAGCSGRPPLSRYYLLEAQASPTPPPGVDSVATGRAVRIGVRTFHVDPPYDQARIVYRVGADSPQVGFYEYHRWAAPLHRMLPGVVAASLTGATSLVSAEPVVPGGVYDSFLSGRVQRIEEIDLATGQRIAIEMHLTLRDRGGDELWSAAVAGESIVETDSVARIVEEMRRVLDGALRDVTPAVVAAAGREP